MGVPLSSIINVTTRIAAGGTPNQQHGKGLVITTDDSIAAGGPDKIQLFQTLAEAQKIFGSGSALDAATVWFSADPYPKSLYIGRWANVDIPTTLRSSTPADIGVTALSASNASFSINGDDVTVDLSNVSIDTYSEVASVVQSGIQV